MDAVAGRGLEIATDGVSVAAAQTHRSLNRLGSCLRRQMLAAAPDLPSRNSPGLCDLFPTAKWRTAPRPISRQEELQNLRAGSLVPPSRKDAG